MNIITLHYSLGKFHEKQKSSNPWMHNQPSICSPTAKQYSCNTFLQGIPISISNEENNKL